MGHMQVTPTAPGHPGPAGEGVYLTRSTDPWPSLCRSSHTATKANSPVRAMSIMYVSCVSDLGHT
jgi:hypothetical protein